MSYDDQYLWDVLEWSITVTKATPCLVGCMRHSITIVDDHIDLIFCRNYVLYD